MTPKLPLCLIGLLLYGPSILAADIPDYPFVFVTGKAEIDTPPRYCDLLTDDTSYRARSGQG